MYKIISFDIWDTILKRTCHPEEVKLYTAKYLMLKYEENIKEEYRDIYKILEKRNEIEATIGKENKQRGKDEEYYILDVFSRLQEEILTKKIVNLSQELLDKEVEREKEVIFVNPDILPIFEKYKDLKMYAISDFYMGEKELKELLDSVKLPIKLEKIYSSADYLINKKTGNLYKMVEDELDIKPEEHIHVGDNIYSDIQVAKSLGITTIQMKRQDEVFEAKRQRKFAYDLSVVKKKEENKKDKLFNIGVELSPLFYFFSYSILEYAIKNQVAKVFYCTREGETFIKMHEYMQEENPFGVKLPKSEIIEVSRLATFSASLKEFSILELLRIWSQYRGKLSMSMNTLYKSMDIDITPYIPYMEKYDIDVNKQIMDAWFDPRIQRLCENQEFTNKMRLEFMQKREELLKYMDNEKQIHNDSLPLFLVDIGWRGTIQDNLAYIFPEKKIGGYYLALYDFYNRQPDNTYKAAFLEDKKMLEEIVNPMITLIEWIFSPGSGSVVRYEKGQAIRKAKTKEVKVVEEFVKPLQEGMIEGSKIINKYMMLHPYEAQETKEPVYELLTKIKKHPPKELVEAYHQMVFNDTFGTDQYIEKTKKLSFTTRINPFKCRRLLREESWKEAFMVYHKVGYMKPILNMKTYLRRLLGRK